MFFAAFRGQIEQTAMTIRRCILTALALACATLFGTANAVQQSPGANAASAAKEVAAARDLVDSYFGDSDLLDQAAVLVVAALRDDPNSSDAYVEAARIVRRDGHIVGDRFMPGTQANSRTLIDKAMALNPANVRAISLKSEASMLAGDPDGGLAWARRGLAIDPDYVWLKMRIVEYHERKHEISQAVGALDAILATPCAKDNEHRAACVMALKREAGYFAVRGNEDIVRKLAARIEALRDPHDAWTLGDLCGRFTDIGLYAEAIDYGHRALGIMNYGIGRENLASALYLKAAVSIAAGENATAMIEEARSLHVPKSEILAWFDDADAQAQKLKPAVQALLAPGWAGR